MTFRKNVAKSLTSWEFFLARWNSWEYLEYSCTLQTTVKYTENAYSARGLHDYFYNGIPNKLEGEITVCSPQTSLKTLVNVLLFWKCKNNKSLEVYSAVALT